MSAEIESVGQKPQLPPGIASRREFLVGAALGAAGGAAIATGVPRLLDALSPKNPEQFLKPGYKSRENATIYNIINTFVNKTAEPDFWEEFNQRFADNQESYFDVIHNSTGRTIADNVHTYNYYADGIKRGSPNVYLLVIDPDGDYYKARTVLITLQLGVGGSFTEPNKQAGPVPFSIDEVREKFWSFFKAPPEAKEALWEKGSHDDYQSDFTDQRGYQFRNEVRPTSITQTVWYIPPPVPSMIPQEEKPTPFERPRQT